MKHITNIVLYGIYLTLTYTSLFLILGSPISFFLASGWTVVNPYCNSLTVNSVRVLVALVAFIIALAIKLNPTVLTVIVNIQ